jgi:hypothetical protein
MVDARVLVGIMLLLAIVPVLPIRTAAADPPTTAVGGAELVYLARDGLRARDVNSGTDRRLAAASLLGGLGTCSTSRDNAPAVEFAALSLSPDGQTALVSSPSSGGDCFTSSGYLVDLTNGAVTPWLASLPIMGYSSPDWSPDGALLLWRGVFNAPGELQVCDRQAQCQTVAPAADDAVWAGNRRIIFNERSARRSSADDAAYYSRPTNEIESTPISLLDLNSGVRRPLGVRGTMLDVSPDGRFLAYWHNVTYAARPSGDVAILDLQTPGRQSIELGYFSTHTFRGWGPWRAPLVYNRFLIDSSSGAINADLDLTVGQRIAFSAEPGFMLGMVGDYLESEPSGFVNRLNLVDLRAPRPRAVRLAEDRRWLRNADLPGYVGALTSDGALAAYLPVGGSTDTEDPVQNQVGALVRADGQRVRELRGEDILGFSPDDAWLAVVTRPGTLSLVAVRGGEPTTITIDLNCTVYQNRCTGLIAGWRPTPRT